MQSIVHFCKVLACEVGDFFDRLAVLAYEASLRMDRVSDVPDQSVWAERNVSSNLIAHIFVVIFDGLA